MERGGVVVKRRIQDQVSGFDLREHQFYVLEQDTLSTFLSTDAYPERHNTHKKDATVYIDGYHSEKKLTLKGIYLITIAGKRRGCGEFFSF